MSRTLKCRCCGKQFNASGALGKLCPNCIANEENTYLKVRSFVKDNPGVSIQEVSEILSVSKTKILGYVKEERLEVSNNGKSILTCKNCGIPIITGVFCGDCKRFNENIQKIDNKNNTNLRYNDEKSWTYEVNRKNH